MKNEKQRKQRFFNSACHILIIENEVDKVSYEIGATKQTWLVSIIALKVTKDEEAMFRRLLFFVNVFHCSVYIISEKLLVFNSFNSVSK